MFGRIKSAIANLSGMLTGSAPIHGLLHGRMFVQADDTTDLSRVLGTFVVLAFLAYQGYALVALKQSFDPSAFGTGAAAACTGVGAFVLAHNYASR